MYSAPSALPSGGDDAPNALEIRPAALAAVAEVFRVIVASVAPVPAASSSDLVPFDVLCKEGWQRSTLDQLGASGQIPVAAMGSKKWTRRSALEGLFDRKAAEFAAGRAKPSKPSAPKSPAAALAALAEAETRRSARGRR